MSPALDGTGVVELATLTRSGLIESRHLGVAVVTGPDGSVLRELGDGNARVYGRSTLKIIQSIAVLRAGVDLDGEHLVLATASHVGTPRHLAVVQAMLNRAGLGEGDLQCPADWPGDSSARTASPQQRRLAMNCSGKHAAFLLACAENGWPIESYLEPGHPLQVLIRATVADYTGEAIGHEGVDGCGAPVYAVTMRGLSRATARISGATADTDALAARLSAAIRAHAWALDRPAVASVINDLGLIAKLGAEGVFIAGAPNGTAVALKFLDGSSRASIAVGLSLLASVGAIDADAATRVARATTEPVLGGGLPVGELRCSV